MRKINPILCAAALAVAWALAPQALAEDNTMMASVVAKGGHFVKPEAFDLARILPEPPAVGTITAQADLEVVLQAQAWRTPEEQAWAKQIERDNVYGNASVLGAWFAKENLPQTAGFLAAVTDDINAVGALTKKLHARPRPSQGDPRVQPCVEVPASASYPSGHATRAYVWAAVLAEIVPEQREALFARAGRVCWGRVLGGVHYPTDLVGGRLLAEAIVAELRKSAAFRAAIEQCRAEVAAVARKKAA